MDAPAPYPHDDALPVPCTICPRARYAADGIYHDDTCRYFIACCFADGDGVGLGYSDKHAPVSDADATRAARAQRAHS